MSKNNILSGIDVQIRNILVMVALVVGVYYLIKFIKRKEAEAGKPSDAPIPYDIPSTGGGNRTGSGVIQKEFDPKPLTNELKEDIYSYGFRNVEIYQKLSALSTSELVAVYNDYKNRFFYLDKETMIQAMQGESYDSGWGLAWWRPPLKPIVDSIIQRLRQQGLN